MKRTRLPHSIRELLPDTGNHRRPDRGIPIYQKAGVNTDVDRQIGIVLDALRESGLERDTAVIFTSDHGDHDGEHRLTMKRSFYEAAAHVPLLVRWPDRVPAGRVDDGHLINNGIDLLPTLCDLAGAAPSAGLPGRSFLPLALARPAPQWPAFTVSETVAGRMLRTARYKYCIYHHAGVSEELLCDLHDDPLETINLAASPAHRATLHEHRTLLADWTRHHADQGGAAYLTAL